MSTAHVGVCYWVDGECMYAQESGPDEYADFIWEHADAFDAIYIEAYVPAGGYGSSANAARTMELIGVTRHAARRAGVEMVTVSRGDRNAARTRIKGSGIRVKNGHALDSVSVVVAARRIPIRELEGALDRVS